MEKTMKELRDEAKAEGLTVPFGTSKEELKKLVSKDEQSNQVASENKIPKGLEYLNLTSVRKFTKEDVNINHFAGRRKLLDLPTEVKEQLKREGYEVIYPLDNTDDIDRLRRTRGAEFVLNSDGSAIKISSGMSTPEGRLQYHIAMKIKKEFLEEERRQMQQKYLSKKEKIRKGHDDNKLDVDPSLMRFEYNDNNKI